MRLVVGGAYQGKLDYAVSEYGVRSVADGEVCSLDDTLRCEAIHHFEALVRRNFSDVEAFGAYLGRLLAENPDVVVVSAEVGCGVVPVERADRDYRELVGRASCEVSKRAESVVRVFCGLGVRIK